MVKTTFFEKASEYKKINQSLNEYAQIVFDEDDFWWDECLCDYDENEKGEVFDGVA